MRVNQLHQQFGTLFPRHKPLCCPLSLQRERQCITTRLITSIAQLADKTTYRRGQSTLPRVHMSDEEEQYKHLKQIRVCISAKNNHSFE